LCSAAGITTTPVKHKAWLIPADDFAAGIATPGISTSLSYFDQYRREHLPANLVQAQRDFFGSHTYERNDGQEGWFHTVWSAGQSADSITTSGYKA
jgi:6-phosphogluconate dehydrogenase